jgi:predicted RNA-binding protein with TRAM domain
VVGLQVCTFGSIPLIPVTPFLAYESLPDSGSGAGPQRSVEGWVVFVTGIYEETQVKTDVSPSARVVARDITQHRAFMVVEFAVASSLPPLRQIHVACRTKMSWISSANSVPSKQVTACTCITVCISLFLTIAVCSEYADGSQNWLH